MLLFTDRDTLCARLLEHVQAAAGNATPPIVQDYTVGTSGAVADLAVAAEEFIGFVVHVAGEPLDALAERLAICGRYFDRVVVVGAEAELPSLGQVELAGAAVWAVDPGGNLTERQAGSANIVSPAALFDLMTPEQRAKLLRPSIKVRQAYDRARPPISAGEAKAHLLDHLGHPEPY